MGGMELRVTLGSALDGRQDPWHRPIDGACLPEGGALGRGSSGMR